MQTFSIKESYKRAWELWKANKGLMTFATVISLILGSFRNPEQHGRYGASIIVAVILFIIAVLVKIGMTKLFLKVVDGQHTNWKEIFKHGNLFIVYLCTSILFGLGLIIGTILLIIPGIYFALTYFFAPVIVIDQKIGIINAFKKSKEMTKGTKWKLLGFMIVLVLTNILGALVFVVGLLVSIPVSSLAFMHVYRKLSARISA